MCFIGKNCQRRYTHIVLERNKSYFVKKNINLSDSTKMLSETDIIKMIDIVIDKICGMHNGRAFQQTVGIPIGTHCIPDLFRYA